MRITIRFLMIMLCAALAGCGGGGGSAAPKTVAVLKIGTQGTLPAGVTGLSGVGVTITLPQGVTVTTDSSSGNPTANVAIVSGVAVGGSVVPTYTTPTATAGATLRVVVAAPTATVFGVGEFVTVTCLLPSGNTLQTSNFPASILSNLQPADQLLQPVNGLSPTLSVTLL